MMLTYVGKSLQDLRPGSFELDDVRFMGIDDLIECKRKIGRIKDIDDVALLTAFRRKHPPLAPKD